MIIRQADFITSAVAVEGYPVWNLPEIAMAGRSNVGKSSLINALTNRRGLAKVAAAPGKTRLVNFYQINNNLSLVDLAGYGYAKVSKTMQADWGPMIETYLETRQNLKLVLLLMDLRHEPSREDLLMERWLAETGRMYAIVLTKTDKLTRRDQGLRLEAMKKSLCQEAIGIFPVSAEKKTGMDELWQTMADAAGVENEMPRGK